MSRHAVIVYGRFQPPTKAHHMVAQKAINMANSIEGGEHIIYGSHSQGTEKDPVSNEQKLEHMKTVLGTDKVVIDPNLKGLGHVLQDVHNRGFSKLTLIAGDDRVEGFEKFKQYFGKKTKDPRTGQVLDLSNIKSDDFNVISAGSRDPDSDPDPSDMKSISGTKMRNAAMEDNYELFKSMLPSHVSHPQAKKLMKDVRGGIESARQALEAEKRAKEEAKLAKKKTKKLKENLFLESVSPATRVKLARAARRTARRRAIVRKMKSKRRKNISQLRVRAKNEIKSQLRQRVYKGNWKKLSYSQRANIDRMINKRKNMVDNMVKRIMPTVIRGESERMRKINSSYEPTIDKFSSDYLIEKLVGKKVKRQPLDAQRKSRRRNKNKINKRNQRQREENSRMMGNVTNNVMVVKTRGGDIEIIDKESYNSSTHEILVSAEKASIGSIKQYTKNKAFVNTVTSENLFGYIKGAGDSKGEGKSKGKSEKKTEKSKESESAAPPAPTIKATKKSSKRETFPTSHKAGDMESGIAFMVNSGYGLSPDQIVGKGLIDKNELSIATMNPHESFNPSCSRAAQIIFKEFPGALVEHTGRKKDSKLTNDAKKNGVVDRTSKADFVLKSPDGQRIAGLSVKIGGETQLTSGSPAETSNFLKWSSLQMGDKMNEKTKKELDSVIDFIRSELSGNPRTKRGETSLYFTGIAGGRRGLLAGQDEEVARREKLHREVTERLGNLLNNDKTLATYFTYGLLSGNGKFEEGDSGIATHIFSANKDGTDAKITPITLDYAEKVLDKVKFQCTFKSSPVETGNIEQEWDSFKDRKKALGEEITALDDFRQYSFRTVLRAFLSESKSEWLLKALLEKFSNNEMSIIVPPEPQNEQQALDYLDDAMDYIGDDYYKLFKFFEDTIDINVNNPIIDFTQIASPQSLNYNTIYVNGKRFNVPVEEPLNYDQFGQQESPITESKHRNYRKEYDNYHSRPEQRKNRSKRVLARRLMMKLGKVRKGDGKDVDHKDGNPRNNGKHNLRVRNKSENRADNGN